MQVTAARELRHHRGAPRSGDPHPAHHILFAYQTALVHRCESISRFSHFCHSFQTVPAVTITNYRIEILFFCGKLDLKYKLTCQ